MTTAKQRPRRQRGEGSVHYSERHGLWRGQIDVGVVNGVRRRKTVYARTEGECIRKMRDARRDIDAGNATTSSMRLDVWLRQWLTTIAPDQTKPKTLQDYRSKVEQYIIPTIGKHKIDTLKPSHVRDMHTQLRERTSRRGGPLSSTTIGHAHRVLENALNDAMAEVGLLRNVAAVVDPPGNAANTRRGLSAPEAIAVLNRAAGRTDFARWLAGFVTGARQGEILGLRWEHVDLDNAVADLAWSLQRVPYRHGCVPRGAKATCGRKRADRCPKRVLDIRDSLEYEVLDGNLCLLRPKTTGSIRVVPLVPALVAALKLHQQQTEGQPNPHGLVWHRPDGRPVDGRVDYAEWTAMLEQAGVPHVTLHEARHTTADLLAKHKVDRQTIAAILGHSSVATGLIYTHANIEQARTALTDVLGPALELDA